ncbi:MAG: glycosyltransferase family 4 protein [Acidihalobacter sp.]|uniref:glycosyltransferase family 4 protein n=1 Tax=Acidihalobacter sp. TaxID=1872108 RepID=UPI00307D0EF3
MTSTPPRPAVWFPAIRAGSGTDVFTERLAEGLRRRGIRAEISWLPHRAEYAPWTVAKPQPPEWANIVHVNSGLPRRFLPLTLPVVATVHGCVHDPTLTSYKSRAQTLYHRYWIYKIEANTLSIADRIVAVSRYTAQQTSTAFNRQDIAVIPNAIDLSGPFQPVERIAPHKPFRLLYVGNWSHLKGVDLLAPIMEMLGTEFELCYTADRKKLHKRHTLPANSRCLGRFSEPAQLAAVYREADALIFPSRVEGFGLVALEAQASGTPVIATKVAALPEVIDDGITGLLCSQDDVYTFTSAARRLAKNLDLWHSMRGASRRHVESQFDLNMMLDRYVEQYQTALIESE